jgi:hypothetical protein
MKNPGQITIFLKKKPVVPARNHIQYLQILTLIVAKI